MTKCRSHNEKLSATTKENVNTEFRCKTKMWGYNNQINKIREKCQEQEDTGILWKSKEAIIKYYNFSNSMNKDLF